MLLSMTLIKQNCKAFAIEINGNMQYFYVVLCSVYAA